jgi:hypothetical protein
MMAGKLFKLGDGGTMLIPSMDVHEEAKAMARRLGIRGQVEVTVGRWEENGRLVGWTKKGSDGADEVLVEVFVSDLNAENREFDRYAREMLALIEENKRLKAKLAELEPAQ